MQNPYMHLMGLLGGPAGVQDPRQSFPFQSLPITGVKSGMPQGYPGDQVRTQPVDRTMPSAQGGMQNGGLLGGGGMGNYQSFNPWNSPSARMFDQYMQHAMQQRPGGFFGFNSYQFPTSAPAAAAPAASNNPADQPWWGNTVGGGN